MTIINMKKIQSVRIFLISALLILFTSQFLLLPVLAQDELGEIIMGVPANFPPQYYVDGETGETYGFAIDFMNEIALRSGLKVHYIMFDTWAEVNEALKVGQIDGIPNMGIADERKEFMDFTIPVETSHISIFVRSTTTDIHNIYELAGRKVAVVTASKGLYIMEEREGVDLVIYNSLEEAFLYLISGNVDALVYPEPTVFQIAYQSNLNDHIKVVGEPLIEIKRAIAVRKDQPELLNVLDREVKAFVATPEYGEMYTKWNGEPEPYWNAKRVGTTMAIILAIIVIFLLSWHYFSVVKLNNSLKSSITEREQTEDILKETTDYLNKLIDYTNAPFVVWDPEFRITKVNHAFERLTGYNADEIVNTKLPMYFPKESREQSMEQVKCTSSGEYWESIEIPILQKDGFVRYLVWNSANLYDKDGETVAITIAQGIDITDRKRMADEIKQMNIDLEQRIEERTSELTVVNKELEAFSYSVSHDLRAPLRSVDGFSQALLEDYGDKFDEIGKDYLNRVRNATIDMGHLIDDILNLSRITRGDVNYDEVDLSKLFLDIAERYKKEQPERDIDLIISKGLKVNGDERLLKAMLENLISNAYKFSSQEPIAKIEFGMTSINDEDAYYVRDNGVGFDMKYADKLFGAFQRLHSKAEFPGTGVGLATVQRIIHKHGGRVWAESELGKGATFYFTI